MVALQVISSIHKDHNNLLYPVIQKKAEILCLVGNIGQVEEAGYEVFLQSLAATFQTVLIVPGNEDYYSQQYSMQEVNEKISSICQNHSNVIFLNNKSVVIGNTEFIGKHMNTIQSSLADFTNILVSDDKHVITPRDYNKLHKDDVTFISNSVMSAKSAGTQSIVVLTHFPPSSNGTFDPAAMSPVIKSTYFTDIEHVLGPPVGLWVFGHTNKECTITTAQGTMLVSNPHNARDFDPNKTFHLPSKALSSSIEKT